MLKLIFGGTCLSFKASPGKSVIVIKCVNASNEFPIEKLTWFTASEDY